MVELTEGAMPAIAEQFSLTGRRALVTGGGRGIGQAIALAMAAAGASVALTSRSVDQLEATRRSIEEGGGRAVALPVDLGDAAMIAPLVDAAEEQLGGHVDIVVHSAGTQHRSPAATFPLEGWERVLSVNLTAPFLLSQEVGRRQLERGEPGSHIFVCSLTSILGLPNLAAYNAAKSGLMGVVRALSVEWARAGIRVNGISPGYVETAMTKDLLADPVRRAELFARIPAQRFGTTEELGAPAVFLAADASAYMTGQLLIVDGGWAAA